MRIRIRRQHDAKLKPEELADYLNYKLKLQGYSVIYHPSDNPQYGTLIITQREFDKQKLGHILSEEKYAQLTAVDRTKPVRDRIDRMKKYIVNQGKRAVNRLSRAVSELEDTVNGGQR